MNQKVVRNNPMNDDQTKEEKETFISHENTAKVKNVMVMIEGKSFICDCRCNVFHRPKPDDKLLYECNSCGERYRGK